MSEKALTETLTQLLIDERTRNTELCEMCKTLFGFVSPMVAERLKPKLRELGIEVD